MGIVPHPYQYVKSVFLILPIPVGFWKYLIIVSPAFLWGPQTFSFNRIPLICLWCFSIYLFIWLFEWLLWILYYTHKTYQHLLGQTFTSLSQVQKSYLSLHPFILSHLQSNCFTISLTYTESHIRHFPNAFISWTPTVKLRFQQADTPVWD